MTRKQKTILITSIIAAGAATGVTIYLFRKSRSAKKINRKERVSDEGYETAEDILFPLTNRRRWQL
jgi:hypothetical protein